MKKLLYITLLLAATLTRAQEQVFTLYQYTPLLYDPTISAHDIQASIRIFREEYTLGGGDFISTDVVNAECPILRKSNGQRVGGIGLSFLKRGAGESDLLTTYMAGLSVANQIRLSPRHSIYLGITGNYYHKRTSMDQLSTGSQWIAEEFYFDPNAAMGERFETARIGFFSLGTGLSWEFIKDDIRHSFIGISAFHLNRPNESFFSSEANIPVTYLVNAGTVLYSSRRIMISPQLIHSRRGQNSSTQTILSTKLPFENHNPYDIIRSGNVEVLVNYDFKEDATLGLAFNQPGFSFGIGYNFPITSRAEDGYLKNAFQIGLSITKAIWKKKTQKVVIASVPERRDFNFDQPETEATPAQASEVDLIKEKLGELSDVRSLQFELSKDFKFSFGKAELIPEADPFLDELYQLMMAHPEFSLTIVGHTDNVGKQQLNYELSLARARVVAEKLLDRGLSADRINVIGKGDTEPLNNNETEQEKASNRRVEFIINVDQEP